MADLVIYRGVQYDAGNLPAHIDPAECVPLAEWFKQNAKGPTHKAETPAEGEKPKGKPGRKRVSRK